MTASPQKNQPDFFTQIALTEIRDSSLKTPREPLPFDKRAAVLTPTEQAPIPTVQPMHTKEELDKALAEMRKTYAPYLRSCAPELPAVNQRTYLREFLLNGEESVTIPHFDGPVGNAVKTYTTEFSLDAFDGKAVYICFRGADYIAKVYINDTCVGIHEGFFSPFEFEITSAAKVGKNTLKVVLENDFVFRGGTVEGVNGSAKGLPEIEGDKLYAETGLGFDDPNVGWHHCPPGMGIYGDVFVEVRNTMHITDLYVRPLLDEQAAELWLEVENALHTKEDLTFHLSLYGKNFEETVFEALSYEPMSGTNPLPASYGKNVYKVRLSIPDCKVWDLETPYLYELQVAVFSADTLCDQGKIAFGMRSFTQDTDSEIKGKFYLNGRNIRLRGANTMGFEQRDVLKKDFDQLIDDILLAKICHMNYWRLTQRPVQDEVYAYCDMLGLLTQTDFPLFSVMRRSKFAEGVRQAEEMIRMVRKHPCNIMLTYMNEPYGNVEPGTRPHRHMTRPEMESFFKACDLILKFNCPDCVIKHIDGDFESPDLSGSNCMPDFHTYNLWYGGSLPFGKMYRGYWTPTLPGWYYGCGEYGTEGMESVDFMKRHYPAHWLAEPFHPGNIVGAQIPVQYHKFFDKPDSMESWVEKSQNYQAFATKLATECFRRDSRMVSFAIHLFIDAFPAGWMKTIMDCERNPKKAYFAYRDALAPILVSLRSDRFTYFDDETVSIEAYVCNDTNAPSDEKDTLVFELYDGDTLIRRCEVPAVYEEMTTNYIASAEFSMPNVADRKKLRLKAILVRGEEVLSYNHFDLEVFQHREIRKHDNLVIVDALEPGEHEVAGEKVTVEVRPPAYFASRNTGHPTVAEFQEKDFYMLYSKEADMIEYLITSDFLAEGFTPVFLSRGEDMPHLSAGLKKYDGKYYFLSLAKLLPENPVMQRFLANLYDYTRPTEE
ncbi:MAG: hypothetical protein E7421_07615 [Ruminococcaceae bacterium]|nr:hypothetical protein [Oscillospiraceae bacterium]